MQELTNVGEVLRKRRKTLGLTIADLATATGYSVGHISQIERGVSLPSMGGLQALAQYLDIPLRELFLETTAQSEVFEQPPPSNQSAKVIVTPRSRRIRHLEPGSLVSAELLIPAATRPYLFWEVDIPPGSADRSMPLAHPTNREECIVLISGKINLLIDNEVVLLEAGDSAWFDGGLPHRIVNVGEDKAVVIGVELPRMNGYL